MDNEGHYSQSENQYSPSETDESSQNSLDDNQNENPVDYEQQLYRETEKFKELQIHLEKLVKIRENYYNYFRENQNHPKTQDDFDLLKNKVEMNRQRLKTLQEQLNNLHKNIHNIYNQLPEQIRIQIEQL